MKQPTMVYRKVQTDTHPNFVLKRDGGDVEYRVFDLDDGETPEGWFARADDPFSASAPLNADAAPEPAPKKRKKAEDKPADDAAPETE